MALIGTKRALIKPKVVAVGGGGTLTYTVTDVSKAWDTSGAGTFTTVNIGTVAADRIIVVTIAVLATTAANGHPSSVTVGGVAMTNATGTLAESTSGQNNYVYYLPAPSGVLNATSATIIVTTPFNVGVAIGVGNLNGSAGASVNDSKGSSWGQAGGASPRGVTADLAAVAVASGGVVVTGMQVDRSTTITASGGSVTVDGSVVATDQLTSMHGTSGSPAVTGATSFNANFVIASFKP